MASSAAFLLIGAICVVAAALGKPWMKIAAGPVHFAELFFIAWILCVLPFSAKDLLRATRPIRAILLFFTYSLLLFAIDFPAILSLDPTTRVRAFQHGVLFAYPLLWSLAGAWIAVREERAFFVKLLSLAILIIVSLPNFLGHCGYNISLGPLLYVPAFLLILGEKPRLRWIGWVFLFFAHFQFWVMWWNEVVQRTTFVNGLAFLFVVPFVWAAIGRVSYRSAVRFVLIAFLTLGFGIVLASAKPFLLSVKPFGFGELFHQSLNASQKPEDVPDEGEPRSYFQARYRKFLWATAVQDWKEAPLFGVRFIPEIPSMTAPRQPNNSSAESVDAPPVSGPHNSYLSILARTGIIGFLLFLFASFRIFQSAIRWMREAEPDMAPYSLFAFAILGFGYIHAIFNIGFEAPHNSLITWVYAGIALAWPREERAGDFRAFGQAGTRGP